MTALRERRSMNGVTEGPGCALRIQVPSVRMARLAVDQMVNAYALAHRRTDFLAVGPITVEQVRRTVGSLKLARMLTPADLQYLYAGP